MKVALLTIQVGCDAADSKDVQRFVNEAMDRFVHTHPGKPLFYELKGRSASLEEIQRLIAQAAQTAAKRQEEGLPTEIVGKGAEEAVEKVKRERN
jgi:hypothetical protein